MTSPLATREFRTLLDVAVDAVIIIDQRGIIEAFNRSAERLFGYEAAEAVGMNVGRLMPQPQPCTGLPLRRSRREALRRSNMRNVQRGQTPNPEPSEHCLPH